MWLKEDLPSKENCKNSNVLSYRPSLLMHSAQNGTGARLWHAGRSRFAVARGVRPANPRIGPRQPNIPGAAYQNQVFSL